MVRALEIGKRRIKKPEHEAGAEKVVSGADELREASHLSHRLSRQKALVPWSTRSPLVLREGLAVTPQLARQLKSL